MKKTNFFIVGAPKSGTTALSEYLRTHPQIFMSNPKEPQYFCTDMPWIRGFTQLEAYLNLYEDCNSVQVAIGEASVTYLYSSEALYNIHQFNKDAKIIVMVRNPVDMVYSLFSELRYIFTEDQKSFEMAWNLQETRKRGKNLPWAWFPWSCGETKLLQYGQVGKLGKQIERAYSIFHPEQVKVIIFDDFTTNTKKTYEDVLLFLGLDYGNRTEFPKINENKIYNIQSLQMLTRCLPRCLTRFFNRWKYLRNFKNLFEKQANDLNHIKVQRPSLSDDFRKELKVFFHNDVEKLSKLLNRDLTHWVS